MGVTLQKSQLAEELLDVIGHAFGRLNGGIGIAIILVGVLLGATKGIVGATIVTLGLLTLPALIRRGNSKPLACGTICASGTLGQIIPPSLILILLADILGKSVGTMFAAAVVPGMLLARIYVLAFLVLAALKPDMAPAIDAEERTAMGRWQLARKFVLVVLPSIRAGAEFSRLLYAMKVFWWALVLLAAISSCGAGAAAVEVQDLYFAQTVVTGTEEPERSRGFKAGLADVVVKLTGDFRITETDILAPILEKATRYVEHFEYEDRMKGIPVHDEQGTRERPHFLRIQFKPFEVDEALKQLGLSKWPADRPVVAVWLGVETASGRYVLHASGPEGYGQRAVLVETSQRRGLPIMLPDDRGPSSAISFDMVAKGDVEQLRSASFGSEALLVGVLSLDQGGYWDMEWQFHWQEQTPSWIMKGVTFDMALSEGLQRAALVLSGRD